MQTLKREDCSVLNLTLKRKWYKMIASGEKKEEYREEKPYWNVRIKNWIERRSCRGIVHHVVAFSLGYSKPDMYFLAYLWPIGDTCVVSHRENPHPEWGETDTPHYVIRLRERVVLK